MDSDDNESESRLADLEFTNAKFMELDTVDSRDSKSVE